MRRTVGQSVFVALATADKRSSGRYSPVMRDDRPRRVNAVPFLLVCFLALLGGCVAGGGDPLVGATPDGASAPASEARFDEQRSLQLVAEADAAIAAGDLGGAAERYRAGGLAWPSNVEAWDGLVAVAARQGDEDETAAASFMAQRVRMFPSDELAVQRAVTVSLRAYLDEQRGQPDTNARQLAYAETWADFNEYLYSRRGAYDPPSEIANLRPQEIPAALATGLGALIYLGTVTAGQ